MALLPTGSNKLLEIRTSAIDFVIKAKTGQTVVENISAQSSSVVIMANDLESANALGQTMDSLENASSMQAVYSFSTAPLFFEQTDYEVVIRSRNQEKLTFWNENHQIRNRIGPVIDGENTLLTGVINFGNSVGYSDLEISADGKKKLVVRIEIYPSKISYKEDYQIMMADISEMVYGAAIDFMQKTYQEFSTGNQQSAVPAIFFQILSAIFEKYIKAVRRILSVPHHKLITEHEVVPEYKAKKFDRASEKWILKHPQYICFEKKQMNVSRILTVKKNITYDTIENRFVKFILQATIKRLQDFIDRYKQSVVHTEDHILKKTENMIRVLQQFLSGGILSGVGNYDVNQSMSLVFDMAPGYQELYKYYLMIQRGLAVHGDVFKVSVKDTAQLYEYWCFIKLFSILKKKYSLISPDIIRVDHRGITVQLVKGKKSKVIFCNPKTGEQITLIYNPDESQTQTVNQRPDNVLELEKKGTKVSYKYIFDAKYRIEANPSNPYYPDNNPGPKVDDINTMHRYRDSIVYENKLSKFAFEKTMFGAYILFPYDQEELYQQHRFYKSIETVNIGGLPFLPGATRLVEKLLGELISDSSESAFERATLPRGIEEKLAVVDWDKRDVLIGTFRSKEQFAICFEKKFYYIPKKWLPDEKLPIHYVALYQTKNLFGSKAKIRYYGEVLSISLVKRSRIKEIPFTRNNGDELYYRMTVREWTRLQKPILPKEKGLYLGYTNLFLLQHSEFVQELLVESEEQYRFYTELKRNANSSVINENETEPGFSCGDVKFIFSEGKILALKEGKIVESCLISEFGRRPTEMYRRMQKVVSGT